MKWCSNEKNSNFLKIILNKKNFKKKSSYYIQGQEEGQWPPGPRNFRGPKKISKFTLALASEPKKKVMKEKNYQKGAPKSDLAPGLELSLPGPEYIHHCVSDI